MRQSRHSEAVLIVGATSAIAQEVARRFAERGSRVYLIARSAVRLASVADDLRVRGAASVATATLDLSRPFDSRAVLGAAFDALGTVDHMLLAQGVLPDHKRALTDPDYTVESMMVNLVSCAAMLTVATEHMQQQRGGAITVVGSVAGDRGRASNYVYGAAKGGLATFAEGLRGYLRAAGVRVITVKPGLVDTPMTAHLPKHLLFESVERVGARIYNAMHGRARTVYVPAYWGLVMAVIRAFPERLFLHFRL